jgi:hypothetical protein
MKRIAAAVLAGSIATSAAFAGPEPSPEADRLCQGFEEIIEGVWTDGSGVETLLFRFATNADGTGCYAWLNSVAQWNIAKAGSDTRGEFRRVGDKREWPWGRSNDGVYVDLAEGTARYVRNSRTTWGKITRR